MNLGFNNNTPVYGSYPGWFSSHGTSGIQVDVVYDLLCSDSLYNSNEVINPLLDTAWNGSTVRDQVTFGFSIFPLPYHNHAFSVNQLVPYFIDLCQADAADCYMLDAYRDYVFSGTVQSDVLAAKDLNETSFQAQWAQQVAREFGLAYKDIVACYQTDPRDTEWDTRVLWKYNASKGVSGAPVAFVNGVKLDNFPETTAEWVGLLDDVIAKQW